MKRESRVIVGRFIIKPAISGLRFDLQAANYETIATSEVYSSEAACRKGIDKVVKSAAVAVVEDRTKGNGTVRKNPKFEVYQDGAGQFRFRLKDKNGGVVAMSEGYKAKASCLNGIKSVIRNSAAAEVVRRFDV